MAEKLYKAGDYVRLRNGSVVGPLGELPNQIYPLKFPAEFPLYTWRYGGSYTHDPAVTTDVDIVGRVDVKDEGANNEKQGLSLGEQKALLDLAYALSYVASRAIAMLPLDAVTAEADVANRRIRFAWETLDKLKRKFEGANDES